MLEDMEMNKTRVKYITSSLLLSVIDKIKIRECWVDLDVGSSIDFGLALATSLQITPKGKITW